jgi:surfeit locus 1 family protein
MAAGLVVLTLLGLGVWQLERHEQKKALFAGLSDALDGASVPLSLAEAEVAIARDAARDHLLVRTSGAFVHGEERYLFATRNGEPGWHVITPLLTNPDNRLVLVDRGFVPSTMRSASARLGGQPHGSVAVKGLLRATRTKGMFTPSNEPHNNIWYWSDIPALLASLSPRPGRPTLPYLLAELPGENLPDETWPRAERPDLVRIPGNHKGYAVTWFALAVALAVIAVLFLRARSRREQAPGGYPPW